MYRLLRQTISKTPLMTAISATIGVNYWHKRHAKVSKHLMANIDTSREFRLRMAHMKDIDEAIGDVYQKAYNSIVYLEAYVYRAPDKEDQVNNEADVWTAVTIRRFTDSKGDPKLRFANRRQYEGYVAYMEPEIDCALIRLFRDLPTDIRTTFTDTGVKVGQLVMTVGCPEIDYCICDGVVKCVDMDFESSSRGSYKFWEDIDDPSNRYIIQTTPTYKGFSGSAVFDRDGQVVGMLLAGDPIFPEVFSIPYKDLMKEFIERGIDFDKRRENAMNAEDIEETQEGKGSLGIQ